MKTSRRKLLVAGLGGSVVAAAAFAGCGETQVVTETKIQEVIKEVPVERVVTKIVKEEVAVEVEKVVTREVEVEVERVVTQIVEREKIVEKIVTVEAMAPKPENVEIIYWTWLAPQLRLGFGPFDQWLRGEFTKRNPHIKVDVAFLPFGELLTKTIASLAGGQAADALHSSVFHARDLYDKGAILELNDWLKPYPERSMENYVGIASIFNQFKGNIYGLPGEADLDCRTHNVNHLVEAGIDPDPVALNSWTREDAVENALKLTQRDGDKITRSGWVANNIRHQQLCGYCYADGMDSIYIEEGRALNPRFRELGPPAFQFEYDMLHVHNVSKPITPDRTDRPDFFNGLNSNVYMSVADIQEFTKQVGGRFPFEMVHVPRGPNWKDLQGTFWNNMMVVPVKGPNPEAGFEFASWYASEEGAIARIDLTGMPSSHLGLFRSPQWQVHKGISVQYGNFFEVLRGPETAGPYPYVRSAAFNSSTAAAGQGVNLGDLTPEEAIDRIFEESIEFLEDVPG